MSGRERVFTVEKQPFRLRAVNSLGLAFKKALHEEQPLQIVGAINANHALLARRAGYRAIYLSGGGVAAGSLGIPDLGMTKLEDVLTDVRRITNVCDTPLLVDADTGFGATTLKIAHTVKGLIKAGAAAMHLEDQVGAKRCGHRPNKELVSTGEMVDRLKAAVDARSDDNFLIMARTDAVASEGIDAAIERAAAYIEAGADLLFPEAVPTLRDYQRFSSALAKPILANITEFGLTPLYTRDELSAHGVAMILYPLSAFRAMNKAAEMVYEVIRAEGTQQTLIPAMQTREELYERINYYAQEKALEKISGRK